VFGARTRVRQTLAIARESLVEVASGRAFQAVVLALVGVVLLMGWNVSDTVFDTSTWPVTHLVAATVMSQRVVVIPWLLVMLYAGELVWKDREVGVAEIADAAPVPTGIVLLGRFLALVTIIVAFQTAFMIGGILLQTLQGYYHFEPGLYLRILFGLNLADFVLVGALAMTVHVLVNQKYLGYIVALLASAMRFIGPSLGIPKLLLYNYGPRWRYSDMNGFGPYIEPFVWFKLYWVAWAVLSAVIAILFWMRGRETGVRARLVIARTRLRGATLRVAGAAIALILAFGGFIFYNTNILNENLPRDEVGRPQAEYERQYRRFENRPQPSIAKADLRIEIFPDDPAVALRGSYQLVNKTAVPIDSVHVVLDRALATRSIAFGRSAQPVLEDARHGYRIYTLAQSLAPGDSLTLSFDVEFRPRGFRDSEIQTDVVGNGAYFDRRWLPFIGYQPALELSADDARKRFGLSPRRPMAPFDDAEARQFDDVVRGENDRVLVNAIVGTVADQIAVMPGTLRRSWTKNGRRYFEYATGTPVTFGNAVFSAKYAVRADRWHDVTLQVFHHPAHEYNIDRMIGGMKAALGYLTSNFGPYQFRDLRVVEIPPYSIYGRAHPTVTSFSEDVFITRVKPGQIDQTFYGTAHETAHSWWGGQARPAHVKGRGFVSESLANYSAMMVTEKAFGPEVARRAYGFQMDRYFTARSNFAREVPLISVEDQPYIYYAKGAVAMYALRDYIGEERVNTALRRYLEKYRGKGPPYPTALDLLAELRAVTPDSLQYLLTDLLETVTLWDVKTERAVVEKTPAGEYLVTLDVVAKKMRADSVGHATEVPMDDVVEIGVFAQGKTIESAPPLYLKRHRIKSGKQTIRITVAREPARAGIDPYRKLIDRDGADNVVALVDRTLIM
jgi:hypothetical protein